MLYYAVEMGEGIAGPLSTVGAITTSLYSCIGIVMMNEETKLGGLYHYPAGRLGHNVINSVIVAMINHISPSKIYVTAAKAVIPGMGSRGDDVKAVVAFLKTSAPHGKIEEQDPRSFSNYFWDGSLKINQPHPSGDDGDRARIDKTIEDVFAAGPRALGNGASYFGINGEKNDKKLDP